MTTNIFAVRDWNEGREQTEKTDFIFNSLQDIKCPFIDLLNMNFYPTPGQGKHRVYLFRFIVGNKHYCHIVNLQSVTLQKSSKLCLTHVSLIVLAEPRRTKHLATEN